MCRTNLKRLFQRLRLCMVYVMSVVENALLACLFPAFAVTHETFAFNLKVTSWDEGKGTVDTNHEDGRSYISALSEVIYDPELTCAGMAEVRDACTATTTSLHSIY